MHHVCRCVHFMHGVFVACRACAKQRIATVSIEKAVSRARWGYLVQETGDAVLLIAQARRDSHEAVHTNVGMFRCSKVSAQLCDSPLGLLDV